MCFIIWNEYVHNFTLCRGTLNQNLTKCSNFVKDNQPSFLKIFSIYLYIIA